MRSATEIIMDRDHELTVVPSWGKKYMRFRQGDQQDLNDPTGIDIEEGELLYGIIRMLKPDNVLETGTNLGISTRYIGVALECNNRGHLITVEHDTTICGRAAVKLASYPRVELVRGDATTLTTDRMFDFMWLDTELHTRYAEAARFWECLKPGGMIGLHDLPHVIMPQFGPVPPQLREKMKIGELRFICFNSEHGVTLMQKSQGQVWGMLSEGKIWCGVDTFDGIERGVIPC
ncbi:MAG: class I SAM-dependent methyltransferase [Candidatus Paceibacterota bacterium]|jgi:hypothetical protein